MCHQTTLAQHQQCNAKSQVFYKTIVKYLNTFMDETMLDWVVYLLPSMFAYNTSFINLSKIHPIFFPIV
jgi:hypothetical protein